MLSFNSIVRDIKEVKIQGATNVAKAAVKALELVSQEYKDKSSLDKAKNIIFKTRPTEPLMRNVVNYVLSEVEGESLSREIKRKADQVMNHFELTNEKISTFTSKKISNGMVVFTHCHSSSVSQALIKTKEDGKRFEVHNTETRPLFQGRITAKELAKAGIPVIHYVDSAVRIALKKADLMLLGADAITSEGKVVNKIGSELFAEVADKYDVPLYICSDSWKLDPLSVFGYEEEIEKRGAKEVWPTVPLGVEIDNVAFEKIDSNLITGIISELGVFKPAVFIEEVKRAYPWMFKN